MRTLRRSGRTSNVARREAFSGVSRRGAWAALWAGLWLGAGTSVADTVTFTSAADSSMRQFPPDNNFGMEPTMISGAVGDRAGREVRRAVLRFNFAGRIPTGAVIHSASLRVSVVYRLPAGTRANSTFHLRRLLQPWSENAVTWNSRLLGTPWEAPGASGPADADPAASSSTFVTGFGDYTFPFTPRLVADVQGWLEDPASNAGWLLLSGSETTAKTARHFATREDPVGKHPVLTVDYSLPPLITTPPESQSSVVGSTVAFAVAAGGTPALRYQWSFNANPISGATDDTLVLSNVQTNDSGLYAVLVSNQAGSVTSSPALLTVTNGPPGVTIISPRPGANYPLGGEVLLGAVATNTGQSVVEMEFVITSNAVPVQTQIVTTPLLSVFSVVVSNLPAASYSLNVTATDDRGVRGSPSSVPFTVVSPPAVRLTSPDTNSAFPLGTNILIEAVVSADEVPPGRVEFFANGQSVGADNFAPFQIEWIPGLAGDYLLSAVAEDTLGQQGTSPPIPVFVFIPESALPIVTITNAPPNFARRTHAMVSLSGRASDNLGVRRVEVQLNAGEIFAADGTTNWSVQVILPAGQSSLRVRAVDQAANRSLPATRYFTYVVNSVLTVLTNGRGHVPPALGGTSLEIGKVYSLKAKPAPGHLFAGWSNNVPSQGPLLNFQMTSNLVLTANFVPNPFTNLVGDYTGLVLDTNAPSPESSGMLSLKLTQYGVFSGKLMLAGVRYPLRASFNPTGDCHFAVLRRPPLGPVALTLHLDLDDPIGRIEGTITDGRWTADIVCSRNIYAKGSLSAPEAGVWSFYLGEPVAAPVALLQAGISRGGNVKIIGLRMGGRAFSVTSALDSGGKCPFYVPLTGAVEALIGGLQFTPPAGTNVSGTVFWTVGGTNASARSLHPIPFRP